MDKLKAAYDEGLARGHYQADSMYAKMNREQLKGRKEYGCDMKPAKSVKSGDNKQKGV